MESANSAGDTAEARSDVYVPKPRFSTKTLRAHPIIMASIEGNINAIRTIIKKDPRCMHAPNPVNGWTSAQYAANDGRLDILKLLASADARCLHVRTGSGSTLAHLAALPKHCWAADAHLAVLAWLGSHHPAVLSEGDNIGCTVAHRLAFSCTSGTCGILSSVLEVDPGLCVLEDSFGLTPLACVEGRCREGKHDGGDACTCRVLLAAYGRRRRERAVATMSGHHARLGEGSILRLLDEGLMWSILAHDRCEDYERWVVAGEDAACIRGGAAAPAGGAHK